MFDRDRLLVVALGLGFAGCVTSKPVGGNPGDGMNDGDAGDDADDMDGDSTDDGVDDGVDDGIGDSMGDTGPGQLCPDMPGSCPNPECDNGSCSGPLSDYDQDGCIRPRCSVDECPAGRTCVSMEAWGSCVPSTSVCEPDGAACGCGGTADCSGFESVCVPDDEAPPPVEQCVADDPGGAFEFTPSIGDENAGQATCTVTSAELLEFNCTGDFNGMFALDLYASGQVDLVDNEEVTIQYWFEGEIEWANEWLRITRAGFPDTPVVAISADELLPPGVAGSDFWPTNADLAPIDIGCPGVLCEDNGQLRTGQAITKTGDNPDGQSWAAGQGGVLPGKFGGETVTIQVRDARQGACGANLGDQQAWYALTLTQSQ